MKKKYKEVFLWPYTADKSDDTISAVPDSVQVEKR